MSVLAGNLLVKYSTHFRYFSFWQAAKEVVTAMTRLPAECPAGWTLASSHAENEMETRAGAGKEGLTGGRRTEPDYKRFISARMFMLFHFVSFRFK